MSWRLYNFKKRKKEGGVELSSRLICRRRNGLIETGPFILFENSMNIRTIIILKEHIKVGILNIYCLQCDLVSIKGKLWWRSLNYLWDKADLPPYEKRKVRVKNYQQRRPQPIIYRKSIKKSSIMRDGLWIFVPFYRKDLVCLNRYTN